MPLAIIYEAGRTNPRAICDHCDEVITDLTRAFVVWEEDPLPPATAVTNLKLVHGDKLECDHLTDGKPHMELAIFLAMARQRKRYRLQKRGS
jgi:hypothetical protein